MPPVNDNFADAIDLSVLGGSLTFDNTGATYETGEPANATGADGGVSIWYRLVLPANGGNSYHVRLHTLDTPENVDTTIEILVGTTLAGLSVWHSSDDVDYPTDSRTDTGTLTLADDQTWYIRVDAWDWPGGTDPSGPYTTDGRLTWVVTSLAPPPPPPTISDVTPGYGLVGTTVGITGTNLDTVTAVAFGTTGASFTIDSPTHITATVPAVTAASGTVTVTNPGGADSDTFTVLYPGPWVQPSDQWGPNIRRYLINHGYHTESAHTDYTTHTVGSSAPPAEVESGPLDPTKVIGASSGMEVQYDDAMTPAWTWTVGELAFVFDVGPASTDGSAVPAVPPASLSGAYTYEYEAPVGTALGDLRLEVADTLVTYDAAVRLQGATPTATDEVFDGAVQMRRLAGSDYTTIDPASGTFTGGMLTADRLTALTDLHDWPITGTPSAPASTDLELAGVGDAYAHTFTLSDLDSQSRFGVVFALDRLTDWTPYTPPALDVSDGAPTFFMHSVYRRVTFGLAGNPAMVAWYRPPRYRLLYTDPQVGAVEMWAHIDGAVAPGAEVWG